MMWSTYLGCKRPAKSNGEATKLTWKCEEVKKSEEPSILSESEGLEIEVSDSVHSEAEGPQLSSANCLKVLFCLVYFSLVETMPCDEDYKGTGRLPCKSSLIVTCNHDKQTSGRQGLGIKDGPLIISGVCFGGKRTTFDESDEEDSMSASSLERQEQDEMLETDSDREPKLKLKKLCRQLLRQVPGRTLKLKELIDAIIQRSETVFSKFSSKADALFFLRQKLEGSPKFSVKGKRVTLSSKRW